MKPCIVFPILAFAARLALSFSQYSSLAGLSEEALNCIIPTLRARDSTSWTNARYINKAGQRCCSPLDSCSTWRNTWPLPWFKHLHHTGYLQHNLEEVDCHPNYIAQWLLHSGIATPAQIVTAVQEGVSFYYIPEKPVQYISNCRFLTWGTILPSLLLMLPCLSMAIWSPTFSALEARVIWLVLILPNLL